MTRKEKTFPYQLYLVISKNDCKNKNMLHVAEQAILGGVDLIQIREKKLSYELFLEEAARLLEITTKYGVPLIINDNINIAIQLDTAGVHVGNNDIAPTQIRKIWNEPSKLIGYSIEYMDQLKSDDCIVSDYLGISPVFLTPTKKDTVTEWGLSGITKIRKNTDLPLIAIGNIHKENIRSVIKAGADCIAVVSAICSAIEPQKAAFELKNEILK
ncbi:thiamine phosphate synthase [Rhizosphaericola mali]|uniref:Thiamine-phosphate synthase n=1 Tax=Rhizosphaericola mali TaxID=2545455 RepID=A0A5P2FXA3_9BACT|nr:thiamine phosphate synthase [Rhizosphaericola mali]QES88146.1 thiamine phosphate synthase [Rhizosphaericola mali]